MARRSWGVGILVLVGLVGLPSIGLIATNNLLRHADEQRVRASNVSAATAVAYEVSQSYQNRVRVLSDLPKRPSLGTGLATNNRALLESSLGVALQDGQYCRLILRSPGIQPVDVAGPGACWTPPPPASDLTGTRSLGSAILEATAFTGVELAGIPGYPAATVQAVFRVQSLTTDLTPGTGAHATVVSGMTIVSSTAPALVGKTVAAPVSRALITAGRPASRTVYAPLIHTEVLETYQPVPGTSFGVFFSVTSKVAHAPAARVSRILLYGYLGVLAIGLGLAGLVVAMLRRRDRAGRRSARALRDSEERLRLAFEHAPIGKALINLDGRYEQVNPAMCRLTGYSEAQLQTMTINNSVHPDDMAADRAGMDRLLRREQTTYTIDQRYVTADGNTVWASKSVSLVRREDGEPVHFVAQVQDVSERKEHERALAKERRRLSDAEAIGHIGSWEMDIATRKVMWSNTLLELFGIDPTSFDGDYESILTHIHPDDRAGLGAAIEACIDTGVPIQNRHRVTRVSDGELRWFDASGVRDGEGPGARLAGAVIDVTGDVDAARKLEEARDLALEASRQKSAFLATMSHEIRTPMNAVIGMTGLLLDTPLDADQFEFVETVRTSGDALLSVINDILDFSKIEAGSLRLEQHPFDLSECVDDSMELVGATSSAKGLELVSHVDERCPQRVVGDGTRVRQVLVNLLSNAVKFTAHGEVVLTVEPYDATETSTGLRFSVSDTGIGIPADRIDSLFQAFSQVDASTTRVYGGTGLGLAITKRLVDAMGGTLVVESTSGVGSVFSFTVVLEIGAPLPDSPSSQPLATLEDRSALIVDDNATNRRILRLQLEGWGMRVTEAAGGDAALAFVDSGESFDLAVVDMKMPGMNGQDLAVLLRGSSVTETLPIVLLSSRGHRRPMLAQRDLFSAVLTKPVRSARLHRCLRSALTQGVQPSDVIPPPAVEAITRREVLRVLLAEDNAVNQRLGRLMVEKLGHTIDVVGNGREATEAVLLVPYDIVLMDVEMPEMDGLEATRFIRRSMPSHKQPRIVAMTASALAEDRRACNEAGMDDYLAKPVHLQDLDAALRKADTRMQRRPTSMTGEGKPTADGDQGRGKTGAVDHRVIETLIRDLGDEGATDVADLIATYLHDSDEQLAALLAAVTDHDLEIAGSVAHKLKSSTALLGADTFAGLLGDACTAARHDGIGLEQVTSLLDAEHDRVVLDMTVTLHQLAQATKRS